ncbi:MAG: hypothetical protein FJ125_07545 [Deltaproteobacteria bacterium]|nr:hypothetical protein [Deltaproteobacteria bacterium]
MREWLHATVLGATLLSAGLGSMGCRAQAARLGPAGRNPPPCQPAGVARPVTGADAPLPPAELSRRRQRVVAAARREAAGSMGQPASPEPAGGGFIVRAYRAAGWPMDTARQPDAAELFRLAERSGYVRGPREPRPADLAFFHHTRDANGNGRLDDPLTLVALVERIDEDGTVHLLHLRHGRVRPLLVNPQHPHQRRMGKKVVNSYLRPRRRGDLPETPYLAGQMLAGFATMLR